MDHNRGQPSNSQPTDEHHRGRRQESWIPGWVPEWIPNLARALIPGSKRKYSEPVDSQCGRPPKQRRVVEGANEDNEHSNRSRSIVQNDELQPEPALREASGESLLFPLEITVNRRNPEEYPLEINVKKVKGKRFQKIVMSIQRKASTSAISSPISRADYTTESDPESDTERRTPKHQTTERQLKPSRSDLFSNGSTSGFMSGRSMSGFMSDRSMSGLMSDRSMSDRPMSDRPMSDRPMSGLLSKRFKPGHMPKASMVDGVSQTEECQDRQSKSKEPALNKTYCWPIKPSPYRSSYLSHPHNIFKKPSLRFRGLPGNDSYTRNIIDMILNEYAQRQRSQGPPQLPHMLKPLNVRELLQKRLINEDISVRRSVKKVTTPVSSKTAFTMTDIVSENNYIKPLEKEPIVCSAETNIGETINISDNSTEEYHFKFSKPLILAQCHETKDNSDENKKHKTVVAMTPELTDTQEPISVNPVDWSCVDCYVRNEMAVHFCVCCGAPKPIAVVKSSVLNDWSCVDCYVHNKSTDYTCVCCGAPKPITSAQSSALKDNLCQTRPTTATGTSNVSLVSAGWSCSVCYVPNKITDNTCVCCGATKPITSVLSSAIKDNLCQTRPTTATGTSNVSLVSVDWSCVDCYLRNKMTDNTCICCGATKPITSVLSSALKDNLCQTRPTTATGTSNVSLVSADWSCVVCYVPNKITDNTCVCCGATKPTTNTESSSPVKENLSQMHHSTPIRLPNISSFVKDWVCAECWVSNKGSDSECVSCSANKNNGYATSPPYDFKMPINFTCTATCNAADTVTTVTAQITPRTLTSVFSTYDRITSGFNGSNDVLDLHTPIANNLNDNTHSAPIISEIIFNNKFLNCDNKNNDVDSITESDKISTLDTSQQNADLNEISDQVTPKDVTWFCYTCHRNNPDSLNNCDGCKTTKPKKRGNKQQNVDSKKPDNTNEPSHWVCSKCNYANYSSKIWCARCSAMIIVPASLKYCTPVSVHNWACSDCGCQNSENTLTCLGCGTYRHKRTVNEQPRWKCPQCYTLNYGHIHTCSSCSINKLGAMEALTGFDGDVPNSDEDLRSWHCLRCDSRLSGVLQSCPSCGFEKCQVQDIVNNEQHRTPTTPTTTQRMPPVQQWLCQKCQSLNLETRTKCHCCSSARPATTTYERPEDWKCSKCSLKNKEVEAASFDSSHCQNCNALIKQSTSLCLSCSIEYYQPYHRLVRELNFKQAESSPRYWYCNSCKAINIKEKCSRCESPMSASEEPLTMPQVCVPDCKLCSEPDPPTPVKCMGCKKTDQFEIFKDANPKPEDPLLRYCTHCWSRGVIVITICSRCTEKKLAKLFTGIAEPEDAGCVSGVKEEDTITKTNDVDWQCELCGTINLKSTKRCHTCAVHYPLTKFFHNEINVALKDSNINNVHDFKRDIQQYEPTHAENEAVRPQRLLSFPNVRRNSSGISSDSAGPVPVANRCETPPPFCGKIEDVDEHNMSNDESNFTGENVQNVYVTSALDPSDVLSEQQSLLREDCMQMDDVVPSSVPVEITNIETTSATSVPSITFSFPNSNDVKTSGALSTTTKGPEVAPATGFTFGQNNDTTLTWSQGSALSTKMFDFGTKTAENSKPATFEFKLPEKKEEKAPIFEFKKQTEPEKSLFDLFQIKKPEQGEPFQFGKISDSGEGALSVFTADKQEKSIFEKLENTKKPFEFGNQPESFTSNLPLFQFGTSSESKSPFQFKPVDEPRTLFQFGTNKSSNSKPFEFGNNKQPEKPLFTFGAKSAQEVKSTKPFEFSAKKAEVASTAPFRFGAKQDKPFGGFASNTMFNPSPVTPAANVFAFNSSFNNSNNMFNSQTSTIGTQQNVFGMPIGQQVATTKPAPFIFNTATPSPYQSTIQQNAPFNFGAPNTTQGGFHFSPQQVPQVQQPVPQQQGFNFSGLPAGNNGGVVFNMGASVPTPQTATRRIRRATRRIVHR